MQELRSCKEKCGDESREVEKFLDNINFFSKKKLAGCRRSCEKGSEE